MIWGDISYVDLPKFVEDFCYNLLYYERFKYVDTCYKAYSDLLRLKKNIQNKDGINSIREEEENIKREEEILSYVPAFNEVHEENQILGKIYHELYDMIPILFHEKGSIAYNADSKIEKREILEKFYKVTREKYPDFDYNRDYADLYNSRLVTLLNIATKDIYKERCIDKDKLISLLNIILDKKDRNQGFDMLFINDYLFKGLKEENRINNELIKYLEEVKDGNYLKNWDEKFFYKTILECCFHRYDDKKDIYLGNIDSTYKCLEMEKSKRVSR